MNVYAETNFLLEIAFLQEEYESCEELLRNAKDGKIRLLIPTFSIGECYDVWVRRDRRRDELQTRVEGELREIARSAPYGDIQGESGEFISILTRSASEDKDRLDEILVRALEVVEVISIGADTIKSAINYQRDLGLSPQDSIVYASVLEHLQTSVAGPSCFLNRNANDFLIPEIRAELERYDCRLITSFENGLGFINSRQT